MSALSAIEDFPVIILRVPTAINANQKSFDDRVVGDASLVLDFELSQSTQWTQLTQGNSSQSEIYLLKCQFDDSAVPNRLDISALSSNGAMYIACIDASLKPKNQDTLSPLDYLRETYRALAGARGESEGAAATHGAYTVSVDDSDRSGSSSSSNSSSSSGVRLIIKKKIQGSTAQLLWAKATMAVAPSSQALTFSFAEMIVAENLRQVSLIAALKQRNSFLESAAKNLTDDLSVLKRSQDDFNNTLMTKMCLLLNSKKKEILRLRELISGSSAGRAVSGVKRPVDGAPDTEEEESGSDNETVKKRSAKRAKTTAVRAKKQTTLKASQPNRSVGPERSDASSFPQLLVLPTATLEISSMDLDERLQAPSAKVTSSSVSSHSGEDSGAVTSNAVSSNDSKNALASAKSSQSQVAVYAPPSAPSTQQGPGSRSAPKRSLKRLIDSSSEDEKSKADLDDASSYLM